MTVELDQLADLRKQIAELSVVARQCIATVCLERYCRFHGLKHPDIIAFIEHLWRIVKIENPDQFVEWEQGFHDLKASGWGGPLAENLLETIPPAICQEYERLAECVIETSAVAWYGDDMEGTREYLLKVINMVSRYEIKLPDFSLFRSSSREWHGGWGSNPSPDELNVWRYKS